MDKKLIKPIAICAIVILIIIFALLIYNNIFAGSNNNRFAGISDYKFSNNEKNSLKSSFEQIENVDKVKVYTTNRIIKVMVNLKEDVDLEKIKEVANSSLSNIKEKNLSYYDIELFVTSSNKKSEVYPKIGTKFKTNTEFVW